MQKKKKRGWKFLETRVMGNYSKDIKIVIRDANQENDGQLATINLKASHYYLG